MTAPLPPGPEHSAEQTEHQRRAAVAAEATRRNTRILVIALVVVPVVAIVLVAVAWGINVTAKSASSAKKAAGIRAVQEVARSVRYEPKASTIDIQVSGICQNLASGMSVYDATNAMTNGFADIQRSQAKAIVEAAARDAC